MPKKKGTRRTQKASNEKQKKTLQQKRLDSNSQSVGNLNLITQTINKNVQVEINQNDSEIQQNLTKTTKTNTNKPLNQNENNGVAVIAPYKHPVIVNTLEEEYE